jgi:hypothetical protein
MMMLYACPVCGYWQDVSLQQAVRDAMVKELVSQGEQTMILVPEGTMFICPQGHGLMVRVTSQDRIFVRPEIVGSTPEEEQGA